MIERDVVPCDINGTGLHLSSRIRTFLDLCLSCIARVLFVLLHWLYDLSCWSRSLAYTFRLVLSSQSPEAIKEKVSAFKKVPGHLILVLGPESVSYRDIVNIIEWCFQSGIRFISFYDHKNEVDPQKVFETVCKYAKNCIQNIKWGKSFSQDVKESSRKYINGYTWKPKISVNIYDSQDGIDSVLEVINQLHHKGITRIDQTALNTYMSKRILAPDPDLAVICGDCFSSYACLPWHVRITQFQLLESHHQISVTKFLNLLEQYSNCEQRYGK